jgi:integrase
LNYCHEMGALPVNPVSSWKIPRAGQRVTFISPEIEEAIYRHAIPAMALFVKVCIRVGARPDIEFAHLEARHVIETPQGQCWRFPASESIGCKKDRIIYVAEDIALIVRDLCKKTDGRIFHDEQGRSWTRATLRGAFYRLQKRLRRHGVTPDEPIVPYTCRHTFAKRMLSGYWGTPVSLEVLAGLMGTTQTTCLQQYAQWSEQNPDILWAATNHSSKHE